MKTYSIYGAPDHELNRSTAARKVGELAAESALFLSHFEYRRNAEPPEDWVPQNRPDLLQAPDWDRGVLAESKYAGFRNDLMIGSFHPNHRAKWTAHELCHGLVGFAWNPGASAFFHATAARLSELLPVALFYFFDEAGLSRCAMHDGLGPLFSVYCPDCEDMAKHPCPERAEMEHDFYRPGQKFIERELLAVHRGLKFSRPIASPFGNLDLCSDGLAYASAQYHRLSDPLFARFIEMFFSEDMGLHHDLQALEQRVLDVASYLTGGTKPPAWQATQYHWIAQDLGWRVLEVAAQCPAEIAKELEKLVENLAGEQSEIGIQKFMNAYIDLDQTVALLPPEEVFAVGYPLPGRDGRLSGSIHDGLRSVCPTALEFLELKGIDLDVLVRDFERGDHQRGFLAQRFETFLRCSRDEKLISAARLVAFEAACLRPPNPDAEAKSLSVGKDDKYRINPEVVCLQLEKGEMDLFELDPEFPRPEDGNRAWVVVRQDAGGHVSLSSVPESCNTMLETMVSGGQVVRIDHPDKAALVQAGVLIPDRWAP